MCKTNRPKKINEGLRSTDGDAKVKSALKEDVVKGAYKKSTVQVEADFQQQTPLRTENP